MAVGAGKMKSEMRKARQMPSHRTSIAASTTHGDQVSSLRFGVAMCSGGTDAADALAQLAHDLGEMVAVGDFQLARPWQVDAPPGEDPARPLAHHVYRVGEKGCFAQVVRHQDHRETVMRPQV